MALFVPAYMPMQYAGQQLPDTSHGQGSQVGSPQICYAYLPLVQTRLEGLLRLTRRKAASDKHHPPSGAHMHAEMMLN